VGLGAHLSVDQVGKLLYFPISYQMIH